MGLFQNMQEKNNDATLLLIPPQNDEALTVKDTKEVMQRSNYTLFQSANPALMKNWSYQSKVLRKTAQLAARFANRTHAYPVIKLMADFCNTQSASTSSK